ncbi:MAG: SAM-dependent chlorinase/fluorinase [Bacteroidetes bacterium]|nr:SAM-dependent chlorinase/fluorinase [Bacteroidota bacterium]
MHHHITITTDAGPESVYVSAFKGILYSAFQEVVVTEINTNISTRNIQQAAFYVHNTYNYFPPNTLHIIDVDSSFVLHKRLLYTKHGDHHFIALDNGVLSLVLPNAENQVFEVEMDLLLNQSRYQKFAFATQHVLNETNTPDFFKPISRYKTFMQELPSIMGNRITANVLAIDKYGNCITNLSLSELQKHIKGRKVLVHLPHGDVIEGLNESYYEVPYGDFVCIKNNMDLLEIAINGGNAGKLLGMHDKSPVIFEFE